MKVDIQDKRNEKPKYPYLARRRSDGALVMVGKHSAVIIADGNYVGVAGDGWPQTTLATETIFDRLSSDEVVTIQND